VTLLTGLPKTGKTTLLAHLLARRFAAAALLDRPVRRGVTVVITEESRAIWNQRRRNLVFGPDVCFFYRPCPTRPTPEEFDALLARLLELHETRGVDLVVFDPLTFFLPFRSESPLALTAALNPLHRLTEKQMAVLLMHHAGKGSWAFGQAARGSPALTGFVEISLELHPFAAGSPGDRRRLLVGSGRSDETPPVLLMQLDPAGADYAILPHEPEAEIPAFWPALQGVLEDAKDKLSTLMILDRWAEDRPRPTLRTLCRWLDAARAANLVATSGTGFKSDPFYYWLPSRMQAWLADDFWRTMHGMAAPADQESRGQESEARGSGVRSDSSVVP
jgi:hypothetical protein